MSDPVDMRLPESFHRVKRTLLLFCAALIVLGLATPEPTHTAKTALIDLKLSTELARWILWISATYYLAGFYFEFQTARRLNTKIMASAGAGVFDDVLRSQAEIVTACVGRLQAVIDRMESNLNPRIEDWARKTSAIRKDVKAELSSLLNAFGSESEQARETLHALAQRRSATRARYSTVAEAVEVVVAGIGDEGQERADPGRDLVNATVLSLQVTSNDINSIKDFMDQLVVMLAQAHSDMTKLNPLINAERRASFWWWEAGGAAGGYVLASIIGWPLTKAAAGAVINFIVAVGAYVVAWIVTWPLTKVAESAAISLITPFL